jgi:hypothetical protein
VGSLLRQIRERWRTGTLRIAEPAVTLTDYALTIEAAAFAAMLAVDRERPKLVRIAGSAFFGAGSIAAFAGGAVHGFVPDQRHPAHRILWSATLIALGGGSLAAWTIGAGVGLPPRAARNITAGAAVQYAGYVTAIVRGERRFAFAVATYLPATLFLLGVFARRYARDRTRGSALGLSGVALTFVAAGIQQGKVALHPRYFDHNALYHLVQGVALYLLFLGLRALPDER